VHTHIIQYTNKVATCSLVKLTSGYFILLHVLYKAHMLDSCSSKAVVGYRLTTVIVLTRFLQAFTHIYEALLLSTDKEKHNLSKKEEIH
jgi:hypothetical protein